MNILAISTMWIMKLVYDFDSLTNVYQARFSRFVYILWRNLSTFLRHFQRMRLTRSFSPSHAAGERDVKTFFLLVTQLWILYDGTRLHVSINFYNEVFAVSKVFTTWRNFNVDFACLIFIWQNPFKLFVIFGVMFWQFCSKKIHVKVLQAYEWGYKHTTIEIEEKNNIIGFFQGCAGLC